jgi:hypothetical protein
MAKQFFVFLILFLTLMSSFVQSQTKEPEAWKTIFSGTAYALGRYYYQDMESSISPWQVESRGVLGLNTSYKDIFQGNLTLIANANATVESRNRLWVNEAFVSFRKGKLFLNLGKQTIKWGTLTGYSALDLANRYDYYDILDTDNERLGLWGMDARILMGKTEIQVRTFQPDNRSKLHLQNNRWIDLPNSLPLPNAPGGEVPVFYKGNESTFNPNLATLGMSVSSQLGAVEIQGKWLSANNDIPVSSIFLLGGMENPHDYLLELDYRPIHMGAINLSSWIGSWNIWSEMAHVNSERIDNSGQLNADIYSFISLGTDRFWQLDHPERQVRLMAQYIKVISWIDEVYRPTELDHIFQSSLLLDAMLQLTYKWRLEFRSVADMVTKGLYVAPNIQFRPSDKIHFKTGTDILAGSSDSFFGNFRHNSRIHFHLTYFPF